MVECKSFQALLELHPRVNEIVRSMYKSKYCEGLALLDSLRSELEAGLFVFAHRLIVVAAPALRLCCCCSFIMCERCIICCGLADMFASSIASLLIRRVRSQAMEQYFRPYSSVDLTRMAAAFGCTYALARVALVVACLSGYCVSLVIACLSMAFALHG